MKDEVVRRARAWVGSCGIKVDQSDQSVLPSSEPRRLSGRTKCIPRLRATAGPKVRSQVQLGTEENAKEADGSWEWRICEHGVSR
jgi:hypothetical protein